MQAGDRIISEECRKAHADRQYVLGPCRDAYLVLVRSRIAARLSKELQWSTVRIGRKIGRDHTTAGDLIHGLPAREAAQAALGPDRCPQIARTVIKRAHRQGFPTARPRPDLKKLVRGTGMRREAASEVVRGYRLRWLPKPWEAD